ncbi:hypothetical protein [Aquabacterium sp. A08]|uniref:hypothetical protein n=1 Tax=Aquabacterium sp. A08 TaxID=2718532 RepID=UPI0014242C80|nr:hypothetical protein [Aquabacterium sp. A08]NIC41791.1 hypothetical protein [Aquabacterium sp. A08]
MRLSLALCAALAVLAGCATRPPPDSATRPAATVAPAGGVNTHHYEGGRLVTDTRTAACTIALHGEIHAGTVRRMPAALQDLDTPRCTHKRLVLDAGPALLGDAITLGAMLRNRGYDTQVQAGSACPTACLMVFAAGTQRVLPEAPTAARIAFSQIPSDHDFGHQSCQSEPSRGQQLTVTRYLRAMLPGPTATAVYQKLLAADCRTVDTYGPAQALAMGLATATR